MTLSRRAVLGAALGSLTVAAGGCARPLSPATGGGNAKTPLNVGLLWTRTGDQLKVAESTRYEQGLRIGLSWVTNRANKIGVRAIHTLKADDKGSPEVAVAAAEDLIAKGCRILVGGFTDPVALRLAELAGRRKVLFIPAMATSDALTGINKYTFRDGPSETQLLMAVRAYVKPGGRLVVLAADPGKAPALLGAAATIKAPASTTDFTAIGKKIKALRADQVYVDWPVVTPRLWEALPAGVQPLTVLGARATWPAYGTTGGSLRFVTPYVDGATNNSAYSTLKVSVPGRRADTGHAEGFTAAQMIVRALQLGPQDVAAMIPALEGMFFNGLKTAMNVRPQDHLMLEQLWGGRLTWTGAAGVVTAVTDRQFGPAETAIPL
ncbi:ABC transporter substrate-binding protein [Actinoplanes subtropicus]|uniref:ABC transporter substrate-binding protein n=1 Tax=Actinoplanes subtropicus TaxID=543632 RepID=UPI000691BF53|nr:ABC transporter substrate-binding protein [Actinoplanes subtropicus]